MALVLNEDQELLRDAAAGFLGEHAPVAAFRALRDSDAMQGFSPELWASMAEMGWAGITVPQAYGGADFGLVGAGIVAEEMGKTLTVSPFLSSSVLGAVALTRFGNADQQATHLPGLASGTHLFALAVDEGRKHGPAKTALSAKRHGNGFQLNGTKAFVVDGPTADHFIVATRTSGTPGDEHGITLFLVPADAAGLSRKTRKTVDSRGVTELDFKNVDVTADAVLGDIDQGYGPLETVLNAGRAVLAAEMVGHASAAFEMTVAYISERKQFGVPVGSFQALQHRAAHLLTEIEMAKAVTLAALQAFDASDDYGDTDHSVSRAVSIAKAKVGQVALLAAQEGIQMHGGMGMTDAFDIGLFIKRVRVASELFGDPSFHGNRLAEALGF
ncbi:MAG: acyl-CoA dehydrogenase family protein [Pseudomonadota bacterium]